MGADSDLGMDFICLLEGNFENFMAFVLDISPGDVEEQ